ncbi:MAG: hypothetical protein WCV69_00795 [Patescibacteria group bacterium]|jgi:hypothetical protein
MKKLLKNIFVSFAVLSVIVWSGGATAFAEQPIDTSDQLISENITLVSICHTTSEGAVEIKVAPEAVPGHLEHGDTAGQCSVPPPVCGNGVLDPGEQCDDGPSGSATCTANCTLIEIEECSGESNLFVNGSFEEPMVTDSSLWQIMSSVSGWVIEKVSDNSLTTLELHRGWSANIAADGLQYSELDGDQSTRVIQNIVTEVGAQYKLFWSFAARHDIAAEQNNLAVEVNGNQVATNGPATGIAPLAQSNWVASDYVFTADGTNTEIAFKDIGPSDSYGTFLDDVRLCKIKEPEPKPYAPWCSALLGILKAYFDPNSSTHLVYNDVADINNDEVINLSDLAFVTLMHGTGDDAQCYQQFEDPNDQFHFSCENYTNIGWCQGLWQGIKDSDGSQAGDSNYNILYDLNNDEVIDQTDVSLAAQIVIPNNQVACYAHFVPPMLQCPAPVDQFCGDGEVTGTEECDAGPNGSDVCSTRCTAITPPNPQPGPSGGGGGGGGGFIPINIFNVQSSVTTNSANITWETTRQSLTWMLYGTSTSYGSEYQGTNYHATHTMALTDLLPSTTYHYQIRAKDSGNSTSYDIDRTFTTPNTLGQLPPQVLGIKEVVCKPDIDGDIKGVMEFITGSLVRGCGPEVYHVLGNQIYHIPNWQYLYDNYFAQRIYNVTDEVIAQYVETKIDNKAAQGKISKIYGIKLYSDGALLKANDGKIYVIINGKKVHIVSLEELKKYSGNKIYNVTDTVLNQY